MATVHVVFKTHLDIGFTDLAANVVENYNNHFIPQAIETAFALNEAKDKPLFIWTTGSWLIHQYLETQSPEKVVRMEEAINKGYIVWHALPTTFHTEFAQKAMIEHGLSMTRRLDQRFNRTTSAAKMTDVPGHTRGLVPLLADSGVKFFHIGVNGGSKLPALPENFIWRVNGKEIVVAYSAYYGLDTTIDAIDDVLVFAHTNDNQGPQSPEKILQQMADIQTRYPDHDVRASTMDRFAEVIWEKRGTLPVVEEEVGDTWIHGTMTDPVKVRRYNILLDKQREWLATGKLQKGSDVYNRFNDTLLLVPEHTWGMDIKMHFSDYRNYYKADFNKARERDAIPDSVESSTKRYQYVRDMILKHHGGEPTESWLGRSYSRMESSWAEQRAYIDQALAHLPEELQQEALTAFAQTMVEHDGIVIDCCRTYELNGYRFKFNAQGALCYLEREGVDYACDQHVIGQFQYNAIGQDKYNEFSTQYSRELQDEEWITPDFMKLGIETQQQIPASEVFKPVVKSVLLDESSSSVLVHLLIDEVATEKYGCPREIKIKYTFAESLELEISLTDKDANRLPESLWFLINPKVNNPHRYALNKLGSEIHPHDVVQYGNRNLHVLEEGITYKASDRHFQIKPKDLKLVALGCDDILRFDQQLPDLNKGFYFNLLNNTWGTNFPLWFEDDIFARFDIQF